MFRIDTSSAANALPAPAALGTPGYFSDGDLESSTPPTTISGDWLNTVQEEIVTVIADAEITLSKTVRHQLNDAINAKIAAAIAGIAFPSRYSRTTMQRTASN